MDDESRDEIRRLARLDTIVSEYVALRSAGGGRLKGLCPFHDEKTPSFHVSPDPGYYNCFGCGESGDVFTFVQKKEQLGFTEAAEWLARRVGYEIKYVEGSTRANSTGGNRARLSKAHEIAAEYYMQQLAESPEAAVARQFLIDRGFEPSIWRAWGLGYSPNDWDTVPKMLRAAGFTPDELTASGILKPTSRGSLYDLFRGRLIWPVRDTTGQVVAFNARKLREDDQGPKYINSPETPIFKKSQTLYGLDKAKGDIARSHQAVVVEGVADVLACHLAGVTTAIASLGTAFGEEHIKQIRRMLMDQDELRGEVIFCFDGDSAGQKAAIKAFADDQKFITQLFVTVEATGLDPCELRLQKGDAAVRELIARRIPLFEFVMRTRIDGYNLDTGEGRVQALNAVAPTVASIKDRALRPEYIRRVAGWLGMDVEIVASKVNEVGGGRGPQRPQPRQEPAAAEGQGALFSRQVPKTPEAIVEREVLKAVVQQPSLTGPAFDVLGDELFPFANHAAVRATIRSVGGTAAATGGSGAWVEKLREAAGDDETRALITELAVDPLHVIGDVTTNYIEAQVCRLQEIGATRRIEELKSRLQRINPVEEAEASQALFGELMAWEQWKRALREQGINRMPPPDFNPSGQTVAQAAAAGTTAVIEQVITEQVVPEQAETPYGYQPLEEPAEPDYDDYGEEEPEY